VDLPLTWLEKKGITSRTDSDAGWGQSTM